MPRDPRYDILFEPVRIGPVTARNRFFQVPHCNGMGHQMPAAHAAMREAKAEGGWAVVSTEECEIHPSSDLTPYVEARLWDDADIPALALMCEKVHRHGALAALELTHNGPTASNLYSREVALAPSHQPLKYHHPHQARAMTKHDIREYRRWHREAALRGRTAGFDIIYVYAAHDLPLPMHFLQRRRNQRTDEYGGSLENRARLLREVIEDTRDAVGDRCAVAVRFAVEELLGADGMSVAEAQEVFHLLGELPDLWDVNVAAWYNDSIPSRYAKEGHQEPYVGWVKRYHHQARRGGRSLHLAGHDGGPGAARRAGPHRCRAPEHRRPVPAAEDRGGTTRRHPRVHRLQHLRERRHDDHAHPLHAESDDGRGVAEGVASRGDRATTPGGSGAGGGRRPRRARGRARPRATRARRASLRGRPGAGRTGAA
jgi:2,4-dienoyl-CoA reductase-like NADH-dependent reductase (Old Yellow Enzyme family)